MNAKHEQFIGIYENALSKEFCENAIQFFENMEEAGNVLNRNVDEGSAQIKKADSMLFCSTSKMINLTTCRAIHQEFNKVFWGECYKLYAENFWILKELGSHTSYEVKMQKTEPGQGYHVWHCESGGRESCHRLLAWTLYLNDVAEGGETEFIYQHMRVKPQQGTLVIWPAGFTHTHRGNTPLSNTKYIMTGWVDF